MTKAIPDDYPRVSPYLHIDGAASAIDFYKAVFGATERMRMDGPDGRIGHAELSIGDSIVMLADEHPEMGVKGPSAYGGSPVVLSIYVEDVDATVAKATEAGATILRPIADQFYGDRTCQINGSVWSWLEYSDARRGCAARRNDETSRSTDGTRLKSGRQDHPWSAVRSGEMYSAHMNLARIASSRRRPCSRACFGPNCRPRRSGPPVGQQ